MIEKSKPSGKINHIFSGRTIASMTPLAINTPQYGYADSLGLIRSHDRSVLLSRLSIWHTHTAYIVI